MASLHVVMVSKALVAGAYQRKLEELAMLGNCWLTAIVPPGWQDRHDPVQLDRAHTGGYELVVAPLAFNGDYHLHFYPTLGRLLRRLRPDILHMDEEPYNLATWQALRLGQQVGARSLFFTWQNLLRRYPWPFSSFERANYQRAAYAIAGNQAAAQVLREKGYSGPLAVIPQFGVDPEIFSPAPSGDGVRDGLDAAESSGGARHGDLMIGYAGRLVPEKGIDVLLRACVRLPSEAWRVRLLGDGPDRERLRALAGALGIEAKVSFLGRLPSTRVVDFYRGLDVFVLPSVRRPSWMEQFGRVLIEAMACQVAVIGSDSGEIPQVIGDAGLVFPEGDEAGLCDALSALAEDPIRRAELAVRGRARVLESFTHARIAAATWRVYQEMG